MASMVSLSGSVSGAGWVFLDCRNRCLLQGGRVLNKRTSFGLSSDRRASFSRKNVVLVRSDKRSNATEATDKWLKMLPDKKSALYSHSLPCIEAWLKSIGFAQSAEERASWVIERSDWHAHLSLDITELRIRYLKGGPGNLERDVERKFSYALCREDLENAILGGP